MSGPVRIEKIFFDASVEHWPVTARILAKLDGVPRERVTDAGAFEAQAGRFSLNEGKRLLWITRYPGNFVKPCPGTAPDYLCCNYWVINAQENCPLDCTYCILQGYLNFPLLTVYANFEEAQEALARLAAAEPGRLFRVGTGELADSLALDPITRQSEALMDLTRQAKNLILELKTKTTSVDHLPAAVPGRLVVSWSVNPQAVIQAEEFKTAPLADRLKAARQAVEKGYRTGFHFDPVVEIPDFEAAYGEVVRRMQEAVPEDSVYWISLGSVRYPASLKKAIETRFPSSSITAGEMVQGLDGKRRYFRPLRTRRYRFIYDAIRARWPKVFIYFCMEHASVWKSVLGFAPTSNSDLDFRFHESLASRFPEAGFPLPRPESYLPDAFSPKSPSEDPASSS